MPANTQEIVRKEKIKDRSKITPVRLTETELAVVDELVRHKNFDSRSSVLRAGLGMLMDQMKIKRTTEIAIECERKRHPPRRNKKLKPKGTV